MARLERLRGKSQVPIKMIGEGDSLSVGNDFLVVMWLEGRVVDERGIALGSSGGEEDGDVTMKGGKPKGVD